MTKELTQRIVKTLEGDNGTTDGSWSGAMDMFLLENDGNIVCNLAVKAQDSSGLATTFIDGVGAEFKVMVHEDPTAGGTRTDGCSGKECVGANGRSPLHIRTEFI